jgi:anti-sigma B factor antagonist
MNLDIIQISKVVDDTIDYRNLIFRISAANILDLGDSKSMWLLLKTLIDGGVQYVIIDMDSLEFIDSSGIGVLINAAKILRARKGDVIMIRVSPRILKIFDPIKLHRFIKIFQSEEEGVRYFQFL